MSRKALTLTLSRPCGIEDFIAANCDSLTKDEYVQLKHNEWHGKRVTITITEHQPTEQDYLNAAIGEGLLCATPDAEHPYTWNIPEVTKEWVSEFVVRVCVRLDISQPWRWAKDLFGLTGLRQAHYYLTGTPRSNDVERQVTSLLDNA